MAWYPASFFVGIFFTLLAGLFVLLRGESRKITRYTWFSLCLLTGIWHAGRFLIAVAATEAQASAAVYVIYCGAIFIPPLFLHFILSLLQEETEQRAAWVFAYFVAALEFLLLLTGQVTQGVRQHPTLGYYEVPTRLYLIHFLAFVAFPSYALFRLIKACFLTELALRKNQLKYVVYATLIGFLGGGTSFLPLVESPVPPFGAPLTYFYTFPIAYAIARYRLMDLNIVFKRSLIYAALLLILLIPCYLLVMLGQKAAFGKIDYSFSIVTLGLFVAVGFLFPKLRFRTEEAFERVLFKRRYDYRDMLLRSSRDMVSVVDLEVISQNLVLTVVKAMGIDKASLYLLDEVKGSFEVKSSTGLFANSSGLPILTRNDLLVRRLANDRGALVREELQLAVDGAVNKDLAREMGEINAELTLPLLSKEKLIGLLNLGLKEGRKMYSDEDLELLSTLANQSAIAIENARLYENVKQSQSIIRRADRLASLGQLTAGLAHEIRNPLVAIRTFTQLLPERYQDPDFRSGFQALAMKEVDRICGLVNDLLSFARPSAPNVAAENINEIVESISRILETEAKEKGVQIYRRLAASLPKIFVDKEQIKQVCMNIILNAIQAIDGSGVVQVSTYLFARHGAEQFVQIGIRDSGMGIAEKDLENIFNPFFTTKKEGSGLGLSISHQIVQEHGGYITVESKSGEGTTFFINLPVRHQNHQRLKGRPQLHEEDPGR
jgi:two-component system, NtrC family, sensor kinase